VQPGLLRTFFCLRSQVRIRAPPRRSDYLKYFPYYQINPVTDLRTLLSFNPTLSTSDSAHPPPSKFRFKNYLLKFRAQFSNTAYFGFFHLRACIQPLNNAHPKIPDVLHEIRHRRTVNVNPEVVPVAVCTAGAGVPLEYRAVRIGGTLEYSSLTLSLLITVNLVMIMTIFKN
jgi:hypothetical protein